MLRFHLLLSIILSCCFTFQGKAQDATHYRFDIGTSFGVSNYIGEGNSNILQQYSFMYGIQGRYLINPYMNLKLNINQQEIKGSTLKTKSFLPENTLTTQVTPHKREYTFGHKLYDLNLLYELHFWGYSYIKNYQNFSRIVPFIQFGLGSVFAPHTKAFSLTLPIGAGLKYKLKERLNLSLTWQGHFTFNDNLDFISSPYNIPSSGLKNKDHYFSTFLTLSYDLAPICPSCNKNIP